MRIYDSLKDILNNIRIVPDNESVLLVIDHGMDIIAAKILCETYRLHFGVDKEKFDAEGFDKIPYDESVARALICKYTNGDLGMNDPVIDHIESVIEIFVSELIADHIEVSIKNLLKAPDTNISIISQVESDIGKDVVKVLTERMKSWTSTS